MILQHLSVWDTLFCIGKNLSTLSTPFPPPFDCLRILWKAPYSNIPFYLLHSAQYALEQHAAYDDILSIRYNAVIAEPTLIGHSVLLHKFAIRQYLLHIRGKHQPMVICGPQERNPRTALRLLAEEFGLHFAVGVPNEKVQGVR